MRSEGWFSLVKDRERAHGIAKVTLFRSLQYIIPVTSSPSSRLLVVLTPPAFPPLICPGFSTSSHRRRHPHPHPHPRPRPRPRPRLSPPPPPPPHSGYWLAPWQPLG
eukprot:763336-Hanusia_phi.AAC.1